jgi:hypothetical protein
MLNTLSLESWLLIGALVALVVIMICTVVDTAFNVVKTIHSCTSPRDIVPRGTLRYLR